MTRQKGMIPPKTPTQDNFLPDECENLKLSPSVNSAIKDFSDGEKIQALAIAESILRRHPEYIGGMAKKILSLENISKGDSRAISEWLQGICSLYDKNKVQELHGRLFILGLSLLDQNLGRQLYTTGFLRSLSEEIKEQPVYSLFSQRGHELWRSIIPSLIDSVPTYTDSPTDKDELRRKPFAVALTNRLVNIRAQNEKEHQYGAFLLHLHGPWGSGKSSLLKLMKKELEEKSPSWIVIEFNAWQNQRTGPPWWSLMDTVFDKSVEKLRKTAWWRSLKLIIWEHLWRLRVGHSLFLWLPAVVFGIIGLVILFVPPNTNASTSGSQPFDILFNFLNTRVGAIISLAVSISSGIQALRSSLVPGSERAAREFMELTNDPMNRLTTHFKDLVKLVKNPIAVFIDDLDRCKDSYTVEFLEGIQTLFREANVSYVIAADRRWIYTSYEKAYDSFKNALTEPGVPFGQLFLAKIFQLSVSLPRLSTIIQSNYFGHLLLTTPSQAQADLDKARDDAQKKLQGLQTEDEILTEIEKGKDNPIYNQALREAAVARLSAPEVQASTEHMLRSFTHLLEPNPRSMKRFLNGYGISRDIDLLRGGNIIERKKLALWTILTFRWPGLAEYLESHPEMVKNIGHPEGIEIPDTLQKLFSDQNVRDVVEGKGIGTSLDDKTISELLELRTPDSKVGVIA